METCLIVDDSIFMRKIMRDILTSAGYEVVGEAINGEEAIYKYGRLRPDVVTMDINMEGMKGLDTVRAIMMRYPDAKIIMCSALMGSEWVIIEALKAGAKDYLLKPFKKELVIETVANVLK